MNENPKTIEKRTLVEIAVEQRTFLESLPPSIPREELVRVKEHMAIPHTVVIAGIRRSGKSTLLRQIMALCEEPWYYFNFEDERLIGFSAKDFNLLYEALIETFGERRVFFFDEIQNVAGWERFVRRLSESGRKFYITGSNASLLSRELGTKLTGRYVSHDLYPFSFREYLRFYGVTYSPGDLLETTKRAALKSRFNDYLLEGGMPEYLTYRSPETLKKVYDDILYRDILVRYDIREDQALRELSFYLLSNISQSFSYNGLKGLFRLGSMNTVRSYIGYLENSFLFFTIRAYADSLKKQIASPKKVYGIDTGVAQTIGFRFSENRGSFLENAVFLELKRRGKELYYYRAADGCEADFLVREDNEVASVLQVSWSITEEKTRERELRGLRSALNAHGLQNGLLLTDDERDTIHFEEGTIEVKPVFEWLLEEA